MVIFPPAGRSRSWVQAAGLLGTFTAYYRAPARPHEDYLGLVAQRGPADGADHRALARCPELSGGLDRFRGVFDDISEALLIQAADHRFLYANSSAEELLAFGLRHCSAIARIPAPPACATCRPSAEHMRERPGRPANFRNARRSADQRIFAE